MTLVGEYSSGTKDENDPLCRIRCCATHAFRHQLARAGSSAPVARKLDDNVLAYESRLHTPSRSMFVTYGTSGLGLDLTAEAWPQLEQCFASDVDKLLLQGSGRPQCPVWPYVSRLRKSCLHDAPVDLLVLGSLTNSTLELW
jgi:hypothetical protein